MVAQLETPTLNSNRNLSYLVTGLVQVFTSSRRSFFTTVMAQALRIAGQGTPVLIVQFLKGGIGQGHEKPIQMGKNLDWVRCDITRSIDDSQIDDLEKRALQQLWEYTQKIVSTGKYSLVVLDELNLAMNFGIIPESEVVEFLAQRPPHIDIIFTGPQMPQSLLDVADQITEIRRSHQI